MLTVALFLYRVKICLQLYIKVVFLWGYFMTSKSKKLIITNLTILSIFGVFMTSQVSDETTETFANVPIENFSMTFNHDLALASNANLETALTFFNSNSVTPNITPFTAINKDTISKASNETVLRVGSNGNNTVGFLDFTLGDVYASNDIVINFGGRVGTVNVKVMAFRDTTSINPTEVIPAAGSSTNVRADFSVDVNTDTSNVEYRFNPNSLIPNRFRIETTTIISSSNPVIEISSVNIDTSSGVSQTFEQKVLSYSPCATNNLAGVTVLNPSSPTDKSTVEALIAEYQALPQSVKNKFARSIDDPLGAYQRYVFICQRFSLNPFPS
jgi:hypothetical protein